TPLEGGAEPFGTFWCEATPQPLARVVEARHARGGRVGDKHLRAQGAGHGRFVEHMEQMDRRVEMPRHDPRTPKRRIRRLAEVGRDENAADAEVRPAGGLRKTV